jgi:molybdenum cofactor guanylyltransferase
MAALNGDITAAAVSINHIMKSRNILGVVMCGGQSSRMGMDKGMIMSGGLTWGMLAFNKFSEMSIQPIVSINASQEESYRKVFSPEKLLIDSVVSHGLLKGVLSVHKSFPEHDLMLLACDMKNMGVECLNILIKSWQENGDQYDCYVYKNGKLYEPLAGIYTAGFLKKIFLLNSSNEIADYSMQSIIRKGKVFEIEVSDSIKPHFRNFNKPSEIEE